MKLFLSTTALFAIALGIAAPTVQAAPGVQAVPGVPASHAVQFASHRAIYDLRLLRTNGSRGVSSVRGRILYDFSGSACEGYTLKFRQVSEIDSGEGDGVLSDLRSTSWEDQSAHKYRFNSQNLVNEKQTEAVDGHADRLPKTVTVTLAKPEEKKLTMPAEAVFPTEHMRRIVEAARAGKTMLQFPVYDGSDNGQKLYDTMTVIGKAIPPGEKPVNDAGAKIAELARLTRWPVTISYFDKQSDDQEQTGEQTPVYAITFELYENGISRALTLDYKDFTLAGDLTSLEVRHEKPCN